MIKTVRAAQVLQENLACLLVTCAISAGGRGAIRPAFGRRSFAATGSVRPGCACSHGRSRVHPTGRSRGRGFEWGRILAVQTLTRLINDFASIEA